ncbi:MAG: molybdopterin-dependent oxidoreductase [Armatimonadota bacterium]|nr:molybdopterin-dependent oxidoreductase [Armatimonadota bacterium]
MRRRWAWHGALAGALAGGVLVWALVTGVFPAGPALAAGIAERVRGLLPLHALAFLIVRLKFAAKPLGFWTSMGAVVVVCGVLGGLQAARLARRPLLAGLAVAGATGLGLALLAAPPALRYLAALLGAEGVAQPEAVATRLVALSVAAYAGLVAAAYVLAGLLTGRVRRRVPTATSAASAPPSRLPASGASGNVGRREFLARSIVIGGAFAGAGTLGRWLRATPARAAAAAQSIFHRIKGLPPEVTPNDRFYVVSKNPAGLDPRLDAKKWTLEITGLVATPVKLTYDEIRAMPSFARYHTLECISNEVGGDLIGNALWKGVRFRDLVARAGGVSPRAVRFALRCADGYSEGIPVADMMRPDVMLAYEMNGVPLPPSHGFPVRLLIPGLFGMKNPKWLTRIEAVTTDFTGYWQASGWSDEAVVKTMSAFRVPGRGVATLGEVAVGGVAYSGDRGIRDVELSTDGGKTWVKAEVKPPLGPYTWVLWATTWTPTAPGEYTLKVRARDGQGVMQAAQETPTLPDGATGYHTIRIRVRQ